MAADLNLLVGWVGILAGCVAGAVAGLFFHDEMWLGGYGSWKRRMIRLAHVSFFGLGLINIAFGLTARALAPAAPLAWPSALLVAGAAGMPVCCAMAAIRKEARHLLPIPVLSVIAGLGLFLWRLGNA